MKITLDKKILGGFIICSLTVLVVAIFSVRNGEEVLEARRLVNHTHEVLYELDHVLQNTVNAETGARGFVITADENYLEPFYDSREELFTHIERLAVLFRDNSGSQLRVSTIETLARAHIKDLEMKIEARKKNFDAARQLVLAIDGKQIQDGIRKEVNDARQEAQDTLVQRTLASDNEVAAFNRLFMLLVVVIFGVLTIMYFVIMANVKALRKAEAEALLKNWNLAGNGELARRMQGNKSVQELSQNIIEGIISHLDLPLGSLYVRERDGLKFKLQGVHAIEKEKIASEYITLGEGIAGQAAVGGKQILLHDIKPHTYDVVTSFGTLRPKSVLAVPLQFEDRVVGVIELASLTDFTSQQKAFIDTAGDSIAIGLSSALAREEVKDLLEETQRQAEELEAQQDELRQANEELQTKTELLEKSEALLKVQQEELQQTNVELEEKANMLEKQTHWLEDAKNEIEQKANEVALSSKYKSEFLANMSHELRTPLNSILILSQLLSENKNNHLSDKEVEHAKNVHSSGSDLLNLINEILDLSKIEAGKMILDIDEFNLGEIVNSLQATFAEVARTKSVNFKIICSNHSVDLNSDRQRIEQILKNLLSNAFKFTGKGGKVTFEIKEHSNDSLSFSVTDTGIGIPENKKQIIFEAFQQADGSTKRKYGGTGLGLSISRELAYALGGSIHLESEEGKGSTFTLILPKTFNPDNAQPIEKQVEVRRTVEPEKKIIKAPVTHASGIPRVIDDRENIHDKDRVVLIIEDDEKFASTLLAIVRERNYKGIIAFQGTTGISYARHYKPDAIILDMKLPVMNGDEVLGHLKADPELRHIPVQIISGFDYQKQSLSLGAFDYLMKPVAPHDLHKALDRIENFKNKKLKKLLIIEDNIQHNDAIRDLIGNGDVKSYSAYSGTEAQQVMMTENFDCIIVDLGLPDMSGFDLLEKIKTDKKLNSTPIIVYTGKDLNREEATRLHKLSDAVVIKTVNSHERLLDETMLFLHRVESKLPRDKQMIIRKLHYQDEVLRGKRILLVDDDIRNIYSLTNVLDEEGVICITAENGRVAIDTLKNDPGIQLVLMDIMMPEMDGYEATTEIRKEERFKKLPIIALTAKAMKGDKEKCLAAGMSDYISKPVNIDQLLSLMRVWLYKQD